MWLLLQLADSAFPTGGFAHSNGLEANVELGEVRTDQDLVAFAHASLWQAGFGVLPFLNEAHESRSVLADLDTLADAWLTNHVSNRASRAQGRTFVRTCVEVFPIEPMVALHREVRARRLLIHYGPAIGAITKMLGVSRRDAQGLVLHLTARNVLSSAVRLGITGPHEAQRLQSGLASLFDEILAQCGELDTESLAQPAPIFDAIGAMHDRLYSRLFQS